MADTGAVIAGTGTNDTSIGSNNWANPGNITTNDGTYATTSFSGEVGGSISRYLRATNFGFSVPTGSTIDGILVEIEAKTSSSTRTWGNVRIVKGAVISSTTKAGASGAVTTTDTFSSIPTSGASTDKWGETWTAADINSSDFGVVASMSSRGLTVSVDTIRITVYYTEGSVSNSAFFAFM